MNGVATLPATAPCVIPATAARRMARATQRCLEFRRKISQTVAAMGENVHASFMAMALCHVNPVNPFPQIDIIGAVVIAWRVRGKTIRSILCNIVCNSCAQCDAHTYEQTNSSLDWVLSRLAHFTVLRFIFVLCITVCCMHV